MSEDHSEHHTKNEIIIIKRRADDGHDDHHGGVWKIAYADFMTAMMAFFLVMWLVNAANDQTKASVASYFNPIKLVDERPSDRGIKDKGSADDGSRNQPKSNVEGEKATTGDGGETGRDLNATAGDKTQYSESDYFKNPYSVLSEIARETGHEANLSSAGEGGAQTSGPATGAEGGKAYKDPFDPDFWAQQVQTVSGKPQESNDVGEPEKTVQAAMSGAGAPDVKSAGEASAGMAEKRREEPEPAARGKLRDAPAVADVVASADSAVKTVASDAPSEERTTEKDKAGNDAPPGGKPKEHDDAAESLEAAKRAQTLKAEIVSSGGGTIGKLAEGLTVKPAEGGILLSLTDQAEDGMFNVGSAVPRHEMVVAMQKIGKILAGRKGRIVVRGHTDARPFKGGDYDNWRLSTARAESAYYMLVRGGLAEERVVQISGFADRRLADPDHPYSDENRRIEILLESAGEDQ